MYPFNAGSSLKARKVSIQINFDKNVVNCLVDGKKKGLVFNGPKDLRKTKFGLFVETKNQGTKIDILNDEITFVQKSSIDLKKNNLDAEKYMDENLNRFTPISTADQTRENSDRE